MRSKFGPQRWLAAITVLELAPRQLWFRRGVDIGLMLLARPLAMAVQCLDRLRHGAVGRCSFIEG